MSEHLHDIDDFFKKSIEVHSEMPAAAVWEAIENNFNKNNHVQLKKKYQNLKRVAAVLLLLLCGSIFFLVSRNDTSKIIANEKSNTEKDVIASAKQKADLSTTESPLTENDFSNTNTGKISNTAGTKSANELNNVQIKNTKTEKVEERKETKPNVALLSNSQKNTVQINNTADNGIEKVNNEVADDLYVKSKKQKIKNKTNINIENSVASEDELTNNNSAEINLYRLPITSVEKVFSKKNSLNEKIYLPIFPRVIIKTNLVKSSPSLNKKSTVFSATIYASPELAFNRLEDDKPHQDRTPPPPNANRPRDDRDKIKKEENRTTSFSAGVLIDYAITKKISIQSGIGFTSTSTEVLPKKVFAEQNANGEVKYKNNCSFGTTYIDPKTGVTTIVGDSATLGISKNTVQYISVPLNIAYHFQLGKFQISPTLGVAANFLVKQNTVTNIEGDGKQNINIIEGVNKNYYNANIGIGLGYALNKKISLTVIPNLRVGLNALNQNSNVKFYSNSAGIMMGLKYNF
jgi:hypothetical protein